MRIADDGRVESALLAALLFLLPFEPRHPTLSLPGSRLTLLELAGALVVLGLAAVTAKRPGARPRLTAPVVLIGLYAAACLASAAAAPGDRAPGAKFALRMLAMAGFAWVVSALPSRAQRAGLGALAASAAAVAGLAIAEGAGFAGLDPFLGSFRESAVNVGGDRRATAGSEYPNLAAASMTYGLLAGAGLVSGAPARAAAFAAWVGAGMLFTYSRAALLAAAAGLLALALAGRGRGAARGPLAALAALLACTAAFALGREGFALRLAGEGIERWYCAAYAPSEASLSLRPGERRTTPVRVTNCGLKTWVAAERFRLGSLWREVEAGPSWEGARTALPRDLRQGESAVLEALVEAPPREGRYQLSWDMVHEHTTWFRERGVPPASVPVAVSTGSTRGSTSEAGSAAIASIPEVQLAWQPGRAELWSIALGLLRERPLLGFGPDSFRRGYGARVGREAWDTRVHANSLYLEAGATTGMLGLAAITSTLLASAWAALRRLKGAPLGTSEAGASAALAALVVALAVHGLLDYVLAFTGHYLAFGFVVGAAGRAEAA